MIGLAPIRPDLKGRLRELLCIHGQKWSPRLVSRQRLLVFSEALICLSYSGRLRPAKMVVPAGNAPASSGYQPGALLLSYETMAEGVGNAPTSARADPVFKTGAASLYLPAFQNGCQGWTRTNTVRFNKPSCYFDTTWQWRSRKDSHLHLRC